MPSLKQRQEALLHRMMRDEMNGKGGGLFEVRPFQVEVTRQLGYEGSNALCIYQHPEDEMREKQGKASRHWEHFFALVVSVKRRAHTENPQNETEYTMVKTESPRK